VTQTPFRRKIYASGAHPEFLPVLHPEQSFIKASRQWLPQSQVVRPNLPLGEAMETRARNGLWGVWRRNVSTGRLISFLFFFSLLFFYFLFFQTSDIVSSAADEISGETVAIKMVTRIFAKTSLAKRALRELTLLRHFSNHENITGLIDVDGIAESFNEM
jgi:serine/threonine protein kinase